MKRGQKLIIGTLILCILVMTAAAINDAEAASLTLGLMF